MKLEKKQYNEHVLSSSQIEKIGNAIIFLAEKIQPLYKTKVLKLLYLIEEISIKKNGIPFFGVDFQLWRLGPVVKDVYIDLTAQTAIFSKYIETIEEDGVVVKPKVPFNDDEFSDCDIEVLNLVGKTFKDTSAPDLIKITHRENFPWHKTAKATGYLELFDKQLCNSTDIVLDLSMLLEDRPEQKEFYLNTLEFQKQSNHLKRIP